MNTIATLLGTQSKGDELEIRNIMRATRDETFSTGLIDGSAGSTTVTGHRTVSLDAWSGQTATGLPVFLAYRLGELSIDIDLPTVNGGRSPLTVLNWKPHYALAMMESHGLFHTGTALTREEQARMSERSAQLREIRAQNGKPRFLSEGEASSLAGRAQPSLRGPQRPRLGRRQSPVPYHGYDS